MGGKMNRRQRLMAMAFMDEVEKDRKKREKKSKAKTKGKKVDEVRTTEKGTNKPWFCGRV